MVLHTYITDYNALTTNNHHNSDESHMINQNSSQVDFHKKVFTYTQKLHSVIHINIKHHHGNTH